MPNANHLINALAAQDQDEANSAFESMIQDRLADYLEVRKVELASTIMDDLVQEGEGMDAQRRWTRHVSAIGKGYENTDRGHKVSVHRQELKKAARKYYQSRQPHGAEFTDRAAAFVKDARYNIKHPGGKRMQGEEVEVLDELSADLLGRAEAKSKLRADVSMTHGLPNAAAFEGQRGRKFARAKKAKLDAHLRNSLKGRRSKFARAAQSDMANEEVLDEVLSGGSKNGAAAPSNATLNRNILANIRKATQVLRVKGVNPTAAAAAHRDFGKLVAKNPKAPGYMLLRKLAPAKAQAVQSLSQAGVPLGGALEAHPNDFNQALQRIKRFK